MAATSARLWLGTGLRPTAATRRSGMECVLIHPLMVAMLIVGGSRSL
ncbi:MAG TPA: hypothetical protein P5290_08085 [Candidatus Methanomethylicus sp.]|nr:hypothetical protein [Candidatus Methanomethylicus sp.]